MAGKSRARCNCLSAWRGFSHNVKLNFIYSAAAAFASSIVSGSVFLSSYIYFLDGSENSNDDVGFVSATAGVVMVLFALPVGYLTDRYPRHLMLKWSAVSGIAAAAVLFAALLIDSMLLLYVSSALNGVYAAVSGPPLSSIFADSIPSGQRTAVYAIQYAVTLAAGAAGPLIGVFFFLWLGNEWKTPQLRAVMIAGNVINTLSCLLLWFFHDDHSLGAESEGLLASSPPATADVASSGAADASAADDQEKKKRRSMDVDTGVGDGAIAAAAVAATATATATSVSMSGAQLLSLASDDDRPNTNNTNNANNTSNGTRVAASGAATKSKSRGTAAASPAVISIDGDDDAAGDLRARLLDEEGGYGDDGDEDGAGAAAMPASAEQDGSTAVAAAAAAAPTSTRNLGHQTLSFLGLFTLRVKHIPWIIFCSDFTIAVGAGMTVQYFALFFANDYKLSPVEVASIWVASPLLIALMSTAAIPLAKRLGRAYVAVLCDAIGTACLFGLAFKSPVWFAIPLYIVRTGAMNASYPVQRAILMDVVPKNERGKWNSLENLTAFTWTGSAALGGILIDAHNYGYTFFITGIIYVVATAMLCALVPLTWGEVTDAQPEPGLDKGPPQSNESSVHVVEGAAGNASGTVGGGDDVADAAAVPAAGDADARGPG